VFTWKVSHLLCLSSLQLSSSTRVDLQSCHETNISPSITELQGHAIKNQDLLIASGAISLKGTEGMNAVDDDVAAAVSLSFPVSHIWPLTFILLIFPTLSSHFEFLPSHATPIHALVPRKHAIFSDLYWTLRSPLLSERCFLTLLAPNFALSCPPYFATHDFSSKSSFA
jgi:hypothetical protein